MGVSDAGSLDIVGLLSRARVPRLDYGCLWLNRQHFKAFCQDGAVLCRMMAGREANTMPPQQEEPPK